MYYLIDALLRIYEVQKDLHLYTHISWFYNYVFKWKSSCNACHIRMLVFEKLANIVF